MKTAVSPACPVNAPVAQWIERFPAKEEVAGSTPAGRTIEEIASFEGSPRLIFHPQKGVWGMNAGGILFEF